MKLRLSPWLILLALLAGCASGPRPPATAPVTAPPRAGQDLQDKVLARGALRVATDANFPPFSFVAQNGEPDGFDVGVARELARRLGVKAAFVTPDWDTVVAGNWAGGWDMYAGSLPLTRAHGERFHLTRPYYFLAAQFAVPEGSPLASLDRLHGQVICTVADSPEEHYLLRDDQFDIGGLPVHFQVENARPVPMPGDLDCPQAWAAGRTDFVAWLATELTLREARSNGLRVAAPGDPAYWRGFALALDRNSPDSAERLAATLSGLLAEMKRDGSLRGLSEDWFGVDLTAGP
ncbi:MAG: transporter substrate-binding domain-containing protein [Chloroflexi bacterium]|nr:transporter substrate-binding domain-containing protein [Chloroflexota bacterium]